MIYSLAKNSLSIILPCYNPPQNWENNIISFFLEAKGQVNISEVIIVNDGSVSNFISPEFENYFLTYPEFKIVSYLKNKGKGYALREGVKAAKGDLIIYTDIDFPYTLESFKKIYASLSENTDVAIGIRGEEYYTHLPEARVRISKLLRWFIKIFLRIPTDDTQCGLKGFNKKGKEVFLQTTINRYLFDMEFVFLSARHKLSIKTIPVELRPEIVLSTMNPKILLQELTNFLKIFVRSI